VGTTVAHLGDKHLQEIRVACPPAELLSAAKNILDPICDLVILLHQSTTNLRATRDLLLPRLMSGRITLPEAEEVTAATL
jgi:type I restriction enzyme S subunit